MSAEKIVVERAIHAPIDLVWEAYTTPDDIMAWNAASPDWHTVSSHVDLRPGGAFNSRMEAKDGSFGFDFAGTYTEIIPHKLITYALGDRVVRVDFSDDESVSTVRVTFDAEDTHSIAQQQEGWQAILDNFARHVDAKQSGEKAPG